MDFANFWYSSGSAANQGHDAGDPIGQSLRFRGAQILYRDHSSNPTGTTGTYSISLWAKLGVTYPTPEVTVVGAGDNNANQFNVTHTAAPNCCWWLPNQQAPGGTAATMDNTDYPRLRDPSAWYHFVLQYDPSNSYYAVYVNGKKYSNDSDISSFNTTPEWFSIGKRFFIGGINTNGTVQPFVGHMAAVHAIDGMVVDPTKFGRYNKDGVWVPVDPSGLTYGSNGFHLDFADPDDLGADRSGNGNDFTATGFNTDPVGIFSNDLTSSTGGWAGPFPPTQAFDGNTSTEARVSLDTAGNNIVWAPSTDIPFNTLEARSVSTVDFSFNGGAAVRSAGGVWTEVATNGTLSSTASLTVTHVGSNTRANLVGVRINGQPVNGLVDNPGEDYDLMLDSPTQNWATLNPLYVNPAGQPSGPYQENANLSHSNISSNTVISYGPTIQFPNQDKVFLGLQLVANSSWGTILGFYKVLNNLSPSYTAEQTIGLYGAGSWQIVKNGAVTGPNVNWNVGDWLYFAYDRVNTRVQMWINDTSILDENTAPDDFTVFYNNPYNVRRYNYNFGQIPYAHNVDPFNGEGNLVSVNVPEATIVDGRDHFQAITGPGDGTVVPGANQVYVGDYSNPVGFLDDNFTYAPYRAFDANTSESYFVPRPSGDYTEAIVFNGGRTGTTFRVFARVTNGGMWINGNFRSGNSNGWLDISTEAAGNLQSLGFRSNGSTQDGLSAVEIDGNVLVDLSILAQAQQTFPNGLYLIKDRVNSNQWQWVNSDAGDNATITMPTPGGSQTYAPPAGGSVAYCWNTGENGLNLDAGFQLLGPRVGTNSGSGSAVVDHQLGAVPELIIPFNLTATAGYEIATWWADLPQPASGTQNFIYLALASQASGSFPGFYPEPPTSTTITLGWDTNVNKLGDTYYYGLWKSVPGYSAFGSYEGNNNAQGPFVYLGFRPAFLLIKATNASYNWLIQDSTRSPANPANFDLYTNQTTSENVRNQIDFLSNGFKIRESFSESGSNHTYLYAAFAENPFVGSNVVPATAR